VSATWDPGCAVRWLRLAAFLSLWAFFFALVALAHVWTSVLGLPNRWKIISRLSRSFTFLVRTILNIKVTVVGEEGQLESGGYVMICNHVSYVDGIVLASMFPIVFVSKREVKRWPMIGQWNTLCGTIFINRQRKDLVASLVKEMRRKLKQEANILLFPEGTSTNGERILPFQTAPLAAPLRNRSIIVPVSLAYKSIDDEPVTVSNRDLVYWYGDMEFLAHFWKLLSLRNIEVIVTIQPKIECFRYKDNSAGRKMLAADCYNRVLGRLTEDGLLLDEEDETTGGDPTTSRLLSS
jgi:lyso-ornithine lipid O-acyltransferase